ncbi:MAG: formate dehydrogenase accessory sulfurtransferase FdhD [bacterium]
MLHPVYQFNRGRFSPQNLHVVAEVPYRIVVDGEELATMMCTPVKLRELCLGFLAFERFIDSMDDVKSIEVDEEEVEAYVELRKPILKTYRRIFTSGCGGGVTFHLDIHDYPPLRTERALDPALVPSLVEKLHASAVLYHQSRGIHTAGLSDGEELIAVAEDVGRHNALDKLRGEILEKRIETRDLILISTGRISSEMLRKAARLHAPFVISRTSPTSLSIEVAKRLGITLIGYVRREKFNVYSHPENMAAGGGRVSSASNGAPAARSPLGR